MAKNRRSEDAGTDMPSIDSGLWANGSPTEELCADSDNARGWADYTSLNPMDSDVLNQKSGAMGSKMPKKPVSGEEEMAPK